MGRWDEEHPGLTAHFTREERARVQQALAARGLSLREAILEWVGRAELTARTDALRQEEQELSRKVRSLRLTAKAERRRLSRRAERARMRLEADLQALREEVQALSAKAKELHGQVERLTAQRDQAAESLLQAGVAPDDPALGVYLAATMLAPLADALGREEVGEALAYLREAARALYRERPPGPADVATALLRRLDRAAMLASAQVAGMLWGQRIAHALANLPSAEKAWQAFLERGVVPPEWAEAAQEGFSLAGVSVTPEATAPFVKGCALALAHAQHAALSGISR